jgi:hypothetical protein
MGAEIPDVFQNEISNERKGAINTHICIPDSMEN